MVIRCAKRQAEMLVRRLLVGGGIAGWHVKVIVSIRPTRRLVLDDILPLQGGCGRVACPG